MSRQLPSKPRFLDVEHLRRGLTDDLEISGPRPPCFFTEQNDVRHLSDTLPQEA